MNAVAPFEVETVECGDARWLVLRARGGAVYLTPAEAAEIGRRWASQYGNPEIEEPKP